MTFNLYFFEPEISNASEKDGSPKKREPNMFIAYRNERMKDRTLNITMTEFSKQISEEWKKLSEEGKLKLQRNYQIIRDQKMQSVISERVVVSDQMEKHQTVIDNENANNEDDKPDIKNSNFNISKE
ncbi:5196_t:CDS:1 [Funneliformis geosporum]|uniref:18685_t:CDS:1 n=1 Tax=Funneliformis geosporum TaxID=1117311 RepID=A0A9W4WWN8_9GLOM|nr:5196_t:CDS:1 [Funneliformis geosporum]CAI2169155.1 18685_t:CDS:1 [Funneliformis geosporum]